MGSTWDPASTEVVDQSFCALHRSSLRQDQGFHGRQGRLGTARDASLGRKESGHCPSRYRVWGACSRWRMDAGRSWWGGEREEKSNAARCARLKSRFSAVGFVLDPHPHPHTHPILAAWHTDTRSTVYRHMDMCVSPWCLECETSSDQPRTYGNLSKHNSLPTWGGGRGGQGASGGREAWKSKRPPISYTSDVSERGSPPTIYEGYG